LPIRPKIEDGAIASSQAGVHYDISHQEKLYPIIPPFLKLFLKSPAIYKRLPEMYDFKQLKRRLGNNRPQARAQLRCLLLYRHLRKNQLLCLLLKPLPKTTTLHRPRIKSYAVFETQFVDKHLAR